MAHKLLNIDKLRNNKNSVIRFRGSLRGKAYVMTDEIQFAASATYSSFAEESVTESILGGLGVNSDLVKMSRKLMQVQTKTKIETRLSWEGSEMPEFNLEIAFVSVRSTENVINQMLPFMMGVMPEDFGPYVKAPAGYDLLEGGKFTVQIGEWFRARDMVLTQSTFGVSTRILNNGSNLYATGSISFQPHQMLSADEFADFFIA